MKRLLVLAAAFISFSTASFNVPVLADLPSKKEIECLATNIYREARGEPFEGQVAVAKVTLNRVKHKSWPNTICKVVYQKYQFSWTEHYSNVVYTKESVHAAINAIYSKAKFNATHYHADYVNPRWKLRKVAQIGRHIFYV